MNRLTLAPTFLADAIGLIGLPACVCDDSGQVAEANPELVRLLGRDPAGRMLAELFTVEARPAAASQWRAVLAGAGADGQRWAGVLTGAAGAVLLVQVWAKALAPQQGGGVCLVFQDDSARQRDHGLLRQRIQEQQAILENVAVGILFARDALLLECNRRAADLFGYTVQELAGMPSARLYPAATDYTALRQRASAALVRGQSFSTEQQLRRKDGSLFWARLHARAVDRLNAGAGAGAGTVWIVEDISRSRQTQIEVEAIMTNASVSIVFTKNRVLTRYNRGFADMFGYAADSGAGMPATVLYTSPEAYAALGRAAQARLALGQPFQTETTLRRSDGSTLWAQMIGYAINPDEPAQGTIWIIEDRSEHKQAEQSLRNALLENQAILDSAVLGIAVVEHGVNLRCNAKMGELFGYADGAVNGLPVAALYPEHAAWRRATQATARDFRAGRVHTSEHQLVRADGSRFWARLSGRPFDPAARSGRSVWLVDDVTARREASDALRRARDELEQRVLERTAELAGANALLQAEIVERRQAEARVHHMAYHDSLTGLPNRALLADRLERAIHAAQRSGRRLAVMFLDLDRFKTINDSLGHDTGDHLLKEVAGRLARAVRSSDTVARLGGDEFVVLVPGIRLADEAAQVAGKIVAALADAVPHRGHTLHITPSIGICLYPDDGGDVETLMRHADAAMYHAKASGRNNYQFFTPHMNQAAARHFELESSLHGALAQHQFELHFQPIVDTASRRVSAMEVLLRWRRPGLGLVMPDQFIPILEDNGQIVGVGEWVIRAACEQSMAWLAQGLRPVPLALNLSPRQFMHGGLVASVQAVLRQTGIDPALLEFEITETALMQHGQHTLAILDQINAMGIALSIDDFGTGYSSLAYLKRFPVRKLKIDRAFISDLERSAEDRAIVAAILALSHSLQLSVVAEGVETEAQFALLRDGGCQLAQGYLFSQPVPAANARHLLERLVRPAAL